MSKLNYLLTVLVALFILSSCNSGKESGDNKQDTTEISQEEVNEFNMLISYIEENGNYINAPKSQGGAPAMIKAKDLKNMLDNNPESVHVIDIRGVQAFADGHIEGAINLRMEELIDYVESIDTKKYEKIAMVCYTGQSASFSTSTLRMLGYDNIFALKWGMSSWGKQFAQDYWLKKITNDYEEQVETDPNPKNEAGEYPMLMTGKKSGEEILHERASKILSKKFKSFGVKAEELFSSPGDYYIANYWPEEKYNAGHIPTAIHYAPKKSLSREAALNTLPLDKPVVIYCYTGQHSAHVIAYLNMLGYNAKTLLYGANSFMNGLMKERGETNAFDESKIHEYPTVTSEVPAALEGETDTGGC